MKGRIKKMVTRSHKAGLLVLGVCLTWAALPVWAAAGMSATDANAGFKIAPGVVLLPKFGLLSTYTDNFYYQPNDQPKQVAWGYQMTPGVTLLGDEGRYNFKLDAGVNTAKFTAPGAADDYVDHSVDGQLSYVLTAKNKLFFSASHKKSHDPFGIDRTEFLPGSIDHELDKWLQYKAGALYSYGAQGSPLGLNVDYQLADRHYFTNTDSPPIGTRFLDYRIQSGTITGLYHYSGKTTFLALYQYTNIHVPHEFPAPFPGRSGDQNTALVGVKWQATGKTSGDVRVGYVRRGFNDPRVHSAGRLSWQVRLTWLPTERAQVRLETGRSSQVSYFFQSSFINNNYYQISLNYNWTALFQTKFVYRYVRQEFVTSGRLDRLNRYSLVGNYSLGQFWTLTAGAVSFHRNSELSSADFDRTLAYVGITYAR